MNILDYFRNARQKNSATIAKERLQIIIAHAHSRRRSDPDYLGALQNELIAVIAKYIKIDTSRVKVGFERNGDSTVLEVNIPLPDNRELATSEPD